MKNTFTKILLCVFALLATSAVFGATSDEISSVTVSGTTFTITRSTTTYPTTVYYRTCNGSAVGGIHFQKASGSITFAAGESSKQVEITTLTVPTSSIDAFDEAESREFYLEVWNSCTAPKFAKATIARTNYVSSSVFAGGVTLSTNGLASPTLTEHSIDWNFSEVEANFSTVRKNYLAASNQSYDYAVQAI